MASKFYYILFILIHQIYSIYKIIIEKWCILLSKWNNRSRFVDTELDTIIKNIKRLKTIPSHIGFILGTENPSYKDLAKIILWCEASGVSYLSFYDYNGVIKKNEELLYNELREINKDFTEHVVWKTKRVNGFSKNNGKSKKIQINFYSYINCKETIVKVTKQLSDSVKSKNVNVDYLNSYLLSVYENPDPDLVIYCGDVACTYGFLPWRIRVTEFFSLRSHRNVSASSFVGILAKYNKCEQRYGK